MTHGHEQWGGGGLPEGVGDAGWRQAEGEKLEQL